MTRWGRRRLSLVLLVLVALVGCSTNAPHYRPPEASSHTVFVIPGPKDTARPYAGPTDLAVLFTHYVAGALQERGVSAVAVPRGEEIPDFARFVVQTRLNYVDSGSWNLRFWIGFGAGRALIRARTVLLDATKESPRLDREYRARSLTWQFEENILRRILSRIARTASSEMAPRVFSSG